MPAAVGGHSRSAMDYCGLRQQTAAVAGMPLHEEDGEVADWEEDHARRSEGRGGFVFPSFCRALWQEYYKGKYRVISLGGRNTFLSPQN